MGQSSGWLRSQMPCIVSPLARASDNALADFRWSRYGSAALIFCTFSAFLSEFCDMSASNIDKFNELTAKVLGELYLNSQCPAT